MMLSCLKMTFMSIDYKPNHNKLGFIYDVIVLKDDIHVHRLGITTISYGSSMMLSCLKMTLLSIDYRPIP